MLHHPMRFNYSTEVNVFQLRGSCESTVTEHVNQATGEYFRASLAWFSHPEDVLLLISSSYTKCLFILHQNYSILTVIKDWFSGKSNRLIRCCCLKKSFVLWKSVSRMHVSYAIRPISCKKPKKKKYSGAITRRKSSHQNRTEAFFNNYSTIHAHTFISYLLIIHQAYNLLLIIIIIII